MAVLLEERAEVVKSHLLRVIEKGDKGINEDTYNFPGPSWEGVEGYLYSCLEKGLASENYQDRITAICSIKDMVDESNYEGVVTSKCKESFKEILQYYIPGTRKRDLENGDRVIDEAIDMFLALSEYESIAQNLSENDFDVLLIELITKHERVPQVLEKIADWDKLLEMKWKWSGDKEETNAVDHLFMLLMRHGGQKELLVGIQKTMTLALTNDALTREGCTELVKLCSQRIIKFGDVVEQGDRSKDDRFLEPVINAMFETLLSITDPDALADVFEYKLMDDLDRRTTTSMISLVRGNLANLMSHIIDISEDLCNRLLREKNALEFVFRILHYYFKAGKKNVVSDIADIMALLCKFLRASEYALEVLLGQELVGKWTALIDLDENMMSYKEKVAMIHVINCFLEFYGNEDMQNYLENYDVSPYISELVIGSDEELTGVILKMLLYLLSIRESVRPELGKILDFFCSGDGYEVIEELLDNENREIAEMAEEAKSIISEILEE